MKHFLLLVFGFVFLGLGALGLVLPLFPTTPFVLLSAAAFSCNKRLHAWVMRIPFFREYHDAYKAGKGLSARTLTATLVYMWLMLAISAFVVRQLWLCVFLALIGTAVTVHLLLLGRKGSAEKTVSLEVEE